MLINEVCKECNLTKKAIEYYTEQGLIQPRITENGYRQFSETDTLKLKRIAVLRGLGFSVPEIRTILENDSRTAIYDVLNRKELEIVELQTKQALIKQLAESGDWEQIEGQVEALQNKQSILNRILDKFPGFYGKFVCLHFAPFLSEAITTNEQREAFETIIRFLDGISIAVPSDVQQYLDEIRENADAAVTQSASAALAAAMTVSMTSAVFAADEIKSADDLTGKKIGVQLGTTGDTIATDIKDATVERYNKGNDAVMALKQGKIDCVVIDSEPAKKFVDKNDDLKLIDNVFDKEEYAICISKDNTDLTKEFNDALKELKDDGTLDSIRDNYIGDDAGKTPYETPKDADHSKGTLTMATNATFQPYEYYDGDNIVGIDVDIAQAICDKLGYDLKVEDMEFDAIVNAVKSGKADFGAAGMTVTEDRKKSIDFTDPYTTAEQVIIVQK
jgi:ABC-type amino acid transport substrate-binding protein/DNA-binding transcriptional MerR regulator